MNSTTHIILKYKAYGDQLTKVRKKKQKKQVL
jgi:hypothetical protein